MSRSIATKIKNYLFYPRFHFSRFQFNLIAIFFITVGLIFGTYLSLSDIIHRILAATSWTQTDWSGGTASGTVTGTVTTYESASNTTTLTVGEITLSTTSGWCNNSYCNSSWIYRKKITFNNTDTNLGVTSENLTNFPVLVKLTSSNIDYTKTNDDGSDIRFTDPDGSDLAYEIEKWDETGTSWVWVKVPQIDINSSTDYIYLYYGNPTAIDHQQATSVWDANYIGVWHLKESSGTTIKDSTSKNNTGVKVSTTEPNPVTSGQIDGAQTFDGSNDFVNVGTPTNLGWTGDQAFTIEAWVRPTSTRHDGAFFSYGNAGFSQVISLVSNSYGKIYSVHYGNDHSFTTDYTLGSWQQIVLSYDPTDGSGTEKLYKDGTYTNESWTPYNLNIASGHKLYLGRATWNNTFVNTTDIDEIKISNVARSAAWIAASYKSETDAFNSFGSEEVVYSSSGSLTSNIFDAQVGQDWGTLSYTATTPLGTTVSVKVRSSNSSTMSGAPDWSSCAAVSSGAAMSTGSCVTNNQRYLQYYISFAGGTATPTFSGITLNMSPTDTTAPQTNASSIIMTRSNGGTSVSSNDWTNNPSPYFSWTAGADNAGGSGVKGYCLYLGTDPNGDPATSKGLLGTSPVSIAGTTCQFIVSSTSIDFATSSYKGSTWLTTSNNPYYLNIKVIDNSGNVYTGSSAQFQFRFDNTPPTNTSYISCASGSFSNVADMTFSWPTSGDVASSDSNAGLLGWQYQINSTSGTWLGTTTESTLGINNYIPTSESSRTLTQAQDGSSIVPGNNIVYFRTVDAAGNTSSDGTIRTCNLSYGGAAPAFGGTDTVTVTPSTSTSNSYALSWPAATPANGQTVAHYYYMVNTSPPSTLATLQGNATTYIDNGTSLTVAATALPNVNKGSNTVYVVAIDDSSPPNYSPSNYITGTFTLNSTNPDNVGNLVASDSSIKSQSQWNVTLTWTVPSYQGAGNLSYLIYRSTDGSSFSYVGSTSGLSYVDNTPSSKLYYYKIYTRDGANADSSGTNAVSITPTGKWTTAPTLDSGPTVSNITTKKATITWSTSRTSDSKVQYGTSPGSYRSVEPSNSSQVTSHSIQLTGLNPGTTYYYKAKWTDEDGNTGISSEKSFTTASAPTVKDVSVKNIGLTSAIIEFTSKDASKVKIYYGKSTSFGGVKETSTSTSETTYTSELTGLDDGTKYYYKINTFDSEGDEYEGTILDFTTLPRPKISNVRIQQVINTAQPTILVTWTTNTDVSSIVTYYPQGNPSEARDEVKVALTKGEHRMIIRGLIPQTDYILIVKGRDKIGNEATSDPQRFTTAIDTRPPQISEFHVEGTAIPPTATTAQESTAQLVVSWNTDEPSTSQIEFGEGTGTTYSSKNQEDSNLTFNHLVIISGLTPSKVYHLRAISKDKAGNIGRSIDTVTITPKATENALNLVITNLQEAFGFIGGLKK